MTQQAACPFCRIARGEQPAHRLLETEHTLAFLDHAPVTRGHALVIPKDHYRTLFELPPSLAGELLSACQTVGRAVMQAVSGDGLNLGMNVEASAGQVVFHAHYHLIPRHTRDGLASWPPHKHPTDAELDALAAGIRSFLQAA